MNVDLMAQRCFGGETSKSISFSSGAGVKQSVVFFQRSVLHCFKQMNQCVGNKKAVSRRLTAKCGKLKTFKEHQSFQWSGGW